jgi:hypothetical protein
MELRPARPIVEPHDGGGLPPSHRAGLRSVRNRGVVRMLLHLSRSPVNGFFLSRLRLLVAYSSTMNSPNMPAVRWPPTVHI